MSTTAAFQIPRNSLAWLLLAQVLVVVPHLPRMPIVLIVVCIACIGVRIMVFRGQWGYPGKWTKAVIVVSGFVLVAVGYGTMLGVDPAVGLLIAAYMFKLLEMSQKRDAFLVVMLGYFVAMTQFLYFQSIAWTVYVFVVSVIVTTGLLGLNQTVGHRRPVATLRSAGYLFLQSLPLMLVLFLLFPRLPPLWSVPLPNQAARTGVTDSLTMGDISQLVQSPDLAFKVTFEGERPPFQDMYWRGPVLSRFDGRTWSQDPLLVRSLWSRSDTPTWTDLVTNLARPVTYSVILEPTQQNWLFSLMVPRLGDDADILITLNHTLMQIDPIRTKRLYQQTSWLEFDDVTPMSPYLSSRYITMPEDNNPQSFARARAWRAEADSDEAYIERVLNWYRDEGFVYSLRPPLLTDDAVDDFLFNTRVGFCEHYASSFAFLMRAAGIPARIVVGYHGGEYNDVANYVSVYQFEAHSWTEVWLEGKGWQRIDPIVFVAPERLTSGIEAAAEGEQSFLADAAFSWMQFRQTLWLTELRLMVSAVSYYWDTWVVGYDTESQFGLISELLSGIGWSGDLKSAQLGWLMVAMFFLGVVVIGVAHATTTRQQKGRALDRAYRRFCELLAKRGYPRSPGETPLAYADRIAAAEPGWATSAQEITQLYTASSYDPGARSKDVIKTIRQRIRQFRLRF